MIARTETVVGANAERSRSHNRQVILARVRAAGQVGRAEIARASGLSTQAVSNIIADLLSEEMIVEKGRRSGARGLPAVQYALNPAGGYALGVEIRPGAVYAALLDLGGKAAYSERASLAAGDLETVTEAVIALKDRALAASGAPPDRVLGAGIVMPGPFGRTGIRGSGSELAPWHETDPHTWFTSALALPVHVENDANAAAMAEGVSGVARDLDTYAFLYFGIGLGLGFVHQGRLMAGAFGNAGEIGHIPVPCGGETVLLETVVSRLSVQQHLAAAGRSVTVSDDLAQLYEERDAALLGWLARAAEPLSAALTIVENLFDPQVVIFGGAMPEALLDHLIDCVTLPERSVANRAGRTRPRLMRGTSGRMTATLGAAALVINQAFTPMISATQ